MKKRYMARPRSFVALGFAVSALVALTAYRGVAQTPPPCQTPPALGQLST